MSDGYSFEPDALDNMAVKLREGASALDRTAGAQAETPDAGASSLHVARALQALMTSTVAGAQVLDDTATKINTARGSYHDIENTHQGELDKQMHDGMKPYGEMMDDYNGPL